MEIFLLFCLVKKKMCDGCTMRFLFDNNKKLVLSLNERKTSF